MYRWSYAIISSYSYAYLSEWCLSFAIDNDVKAS